jgi:chromosome segregation ATPase
MSGAGGPSESPFDEAIRIVKEVTEQVKQFIEVEKDKTAAFVTSRAAGSADLQRENTDLKAQVTALTRKKAAIETEVTGLETENAKLTSEKDDLSTKNSSLTTEKSDLQTKNANLERDISTKDAALADLQSENSRLTGELNNLKRTVESEKAAEESKIAELGRLKQALQSTIEAGSKTLEEVRTQPVPAVGGAGAGTLESSTTKEQKIARLQNVLSKFKEFLDQPNTTAGTTAKFYVSNQYKKGSVSDIAEGAKKSKSRYGQYNELKKILQTPDGTQKPKEEIDESTLNDFIQKYGDQAPSTAGDSSTAGTTVGTEKIPFGGRPYASLGGISVAANDGFL